MVRGGLKVRPEPLPFDRVVGRVSERLDEGGLAVDVRLLGGGEVARVGYRRSGSEATLERSGAAHDSVSFQGRRVSVRHVARPRFRSTVTWTLRCPDRGPGRSRKQLFAVFGRAMTCL